MIYTILSLLFLLFGIIQFFAAFTQGFGVLFSSFVSFLLFYAFNDVNKKFISLQNQIYDLQNQFRSQNAWNSRIKSHLGLEKTTK